MRPKCRHCGKEGCNSFGAFCCKECAVAYQEKFKHCKKSLADIQYLKGNWESDPCWDIEETEGYEAHYVELYKFRKRVQKQREEQEEELRQKLNQEADELGIRGLYAKILAMGKTIDDLASELSRAKDRINFLEGEESGSIVKCYGGGGGLVL